MANTLIDGAAIEKKITSIIYNGKLHNSNNPFFLAASNIENITFDQALNIAFNWHSITKSFLLTSIKSLSALVDKISLEHANLNLLSVLQTTFTIIADDLSNKHPIFDLNAPAGPNGIHFNWWRNSILEPLSQHVKGQKIPHSSGTRFLLQKMEEISNSYLGVAVQLRVVEAIALDICEAFYSIFNRLQYQGKRFFTHDDLIWITSHIQAERLHHEQVCDDVSGMAMIVNNAEEESSLLSLTVDYTNAWKLALDDFAELIKKT